MRKARRNLGTAQEVSNQKRRNARIITAAESITMRGTDGNALASGGAAAAEHGGAGFGLHTRPESMRFGTVAAVGLKSALGHCDPLLFGKEKSVS
jgi:hypothetical protein